MGYVQIDPETLQGREGYFLMTSLVVPRPIAWVSTVSGDGVRNVAPHSYFNVISTRPPIVHFTSTGEKDTLRNVKATGEFVVNLVNETFGEKMNLTAADFPPEEDEFTWAGLEAADSSEVAPPRVAGAPAAFECRLDDIVSKGNGNMVFGEVVAIHVDEAIMKEGRVDPELYAPIGRLGGSNYARVKGSIFRLVRPTYDELKDRS